MNRTTILSALGGTCLDKAFDYVPIENPINGVAEWIVGDESTLYTAIVVALSVVSIAVAKVTASRIMKGIRSRLCHL